MPERQHRTPKLPWLVNPPESTSRETAKGPKAKALEFELDRLTELASIEPRARYGVGPDVAAALLIAAGENPERRSPEAAFSMLCGSSPIEASSGKVTPRRANRGLDRPANAAL
jgi:hypothetical protein